MHKQIHALVLNFLVISFGAASAGAQVYTLYAAGEDYSAKPPWITATTGKDHIRFASLGFGQRLRLEIINQAGDVVFNSNFREGNLLDWEISDNQGNRVPDDVYGCLITVEDVTAQLSHRRAFLHLANGMPQLETWQTDGGAPATSAEGQKTMTLLRDHEESPSIQLLHDGESGRILSGKGGLSFRIGNALAGNDIEHIRLAAGGIWVSGWQNRPRSSTSPA